MLMLALEPRWMFDGAAVDAAVDATHAVTHDAPVVDVPVADAPAAVAFDVVAPPTRNEVVFIDASVADYQSLAASAAPGAQVVIIDSSRDGIAQMADWLAGKSGIDAIHILGHGDQGLAVLGTTKLTADNAQTYTAEFQAIGQSLTQSGDILLYGCNISGSAAGLNLIGDIAALTGADVAASDDLTGINGDWVLETTTGTIEASLAFPTTAMANYAYDLAFPVKVGGTSSDRSQGIAVDSSGNVYTAGYFQGTADFDPGAGTNNLTSAGGLDIYVQKLSSAGALVWSKRIGGTDTDIAYDIAVDSSGNVYTAGYFKGTTDFDPGAGTSNLTSAGLDDSFILKLDSSGNFVWVKSLSGTGNIFARGIAIDSSNNVHVAGYFNNTADFDPGAGTSNLTSAGATDVFVQKMDSSGNFIWARNMGGTGSETLRDIDLDSSGNVYLIGEFGGTADFDPGVGTANLTTPAAFSDVYMMKLTSSGDYAWAKSLSGTSSKLGYGISVDSLGNVYGTGSFHGTVDFDPSGGTSNLTTAGGEDIYVQKLDSAGALVWTKQISTTSGRALSIKIDSANNVYTTGYFQGTVDFDPGAGTSNLTSAGNSDAFVLKLNSAGALAWVKSVGGIAFDTIETSVIDSSNNIFSTGYFNNTADFDPSGVTSNLTSAGSDDIFVLKLNSSGVIPPNVGPTLTGLGTTFSYSKTVGSSTVKIIDSDVTFADADSADLNTGTLTVTGIRASETISISNQGVGTNGNIQLSGSNVQVSDGATWATIGTLVGGVGNNLTITFNANSTPTNVDTLIQRLTHDSSSSSGETAHDLIFSVSDGDGANTGNKTVNVTMTLTQPTTTKHNPPPPGPGSPVPPPTDGPDGGPGGPLANVTSVFSNSTFAFTEGNASRDGEGRTEDRGNSRFKIAVVPLATSAEHDGAVFIYKGIPDQISKTRIVAFVVPSDAFGHTDAQAEVRLSAKLAEGGALPNWLNFNTRSGAFIGEAPKGFSGVVNVVVTASDEAGNEVSSIFRLIIGGGAIQSEGDVNVEVTPQAPPAEAPDNTKESAPAADQGANAAPAPANDDPGDAFIKQAFKSGFMGKSSLSQQLHAARIGTFQAAWATGAKNTTIMERIGV